MTAAAVRTATAVRDAARDARSSWSRVAWAAVGAAVAAALVPAVLGGSVATDTLAGGAYLALAATGLAICVGLAGVPSLAQGAFIATGAFAAAHLLRHTPLPAEACALIAAVAAAAVGSAAGLAVRSLDAVRVAVGTWLLSWLVALALGALTWLSGGSQGLVVPSRRLLGLTPTPLVHYELAVALTGLCALALLALRSAPFGLDLAAADQQRGTAESLGVPVERLRVAAFAASAFVGGLAGALAVQLGIVADPSAYGPLLSFELLVAVLVGGAAAALGPSVGIVILGVLALAARGFADFAGVSASRFQPMLEALLILAVLATGGSAAVPAAARLLEPYGLRRRAEPPRTKAAAPAVRRGELAAQGLTKTYGGADAARDVSFTLTPGTITGLVGPNGSGKTTILRLLAGAVAPDAGRVALDGADLTPCPPAVRVQAGVVRTLQSRTVFGGLTALETVLVGVNRTRRHGGALRALTRTPLYRAETVTARAKALAALAVVGLEHEASRPAAELTGSARQRLMIAAALATEPVALLLDEPSAGSSATEVDELAGLLRGLRGNGLAILLVEHNLGLVRSVADEILELAEGRVVGTARL
jgi:ABC-type branched-subunit amino acid transport system ATPase component/ABC-type branched-subunit amino acid transport system permease subunit